MRLSVLFLLAASALVSCRAEGGVAVLWTDRADFAFYADRFNASQSLYKVEVFHIEAPAARLSAGEHGRPDVVVAGRSDGGAFRKLWLPLDGLLAEGSGERIGAAFFPALLEAGKFGGTQYLLPVSFNAPFAVFAADSGPLFADPVTTGLEELRDLGAAFNVRSGTGYSRIGFSPTWNGDFPLVAAGLLGAGFVEDDPLGWDGDALAGAVGFLRDWNGRANPGIRATDDFTYRYLNAPPAVLLPASAILLAAMDSSEYFTLTGDIRDGLGFRWISGTDSIPLSDDVAFLGLVAGENGRRTAGRKAAEAFVLWFFRADTQRELLQRSADFGQTELSFGIAGGFSALRPVTEEVFPMFYPELPETIPPADFLVPPGPLPGDWAAMKAEVVLPFLREAGRQEPEAETADLAAALADWVRLNRFR
ncbi:MAG: hypothetical protein FWD94_00705 [Treponema sp.]|nr:hypothetical protein [Treponema sp.]